MSGVTASGTRREFFRGCGRYAVFGLLGLAGVRARRGQAVRPREHRCINKSVCCRCTVFEGCILPAAVSARQARADGAEGGSDE